MSLDNTWKLLDDLTNIIFNDYSSSASLLLFAKMNMETKGGIHF